MPVVVRKDHTVWNLVADGEVDQLVQEFDTKNISPFTVSPEGYSLLGVRFFYVERSHAMLLYLQPQRDNRRD